MIRELGTDEALEILRARKERLERHHNVLIADEALQSSVTLTDSYVTDRMRPDKAIDALDEACAHMQAAAVYPPRAEELMRRRVALLRREASKNDSTTDRRGVRQESRPEVDDSPLDRAGPDPVERFAQDGFGALERFGAELEALFMGPPPRRPAPNTTAAPEVAPTPAPGSAMPTSLSDVESELSRILMEQGIVVRGHDIARVVSLMSGKSVTWPA